MKKNLREILKKISLAEKNNSRQIHLTANESALSPLAAKWLGSNLNTRYVLGSLKERNKKDFYFFKGEFLVNGISGFDELELLAKRACQKMFNCREVDFSPLSGLHAMSSLISVLTDPGDIIAVLPPQYCGHYATGPMLKKLGRKQIILPYSQGKFEIDIDKTKRIKEKIKMIYLDTMHYFSPYPLREIKRIFPQAILVYDASHVLGLIAGGKFQKPLLEGADILSGNSHKTLPGPQKAMIMYKDNKLFNESLMISEIFTSSRHTHSSLSLFITLLEMEEFGKDYVDQVIKNTKALAELLHRNGFRLLGYPLISPQTHQIFIQINNIGEAEKLIKSGISVNSVRIFDNLFIRLGTQQITRLGMKEKEMERLADLITGILKKKKQFKKEVIELAKKFNKVRYCFNWV